MRGKYRWMNGITVLATLKYSSNQKEKQFYESCMEVIKPSEKSESKFKNLENLTEFSFECYETYLSSYNPHEDAWPKMHFELKGEVIKPQWRLKDKELVNYVKNILNTISNNSWRFEIINIEYVFNVGEHGKLEIVFLKNKRENDYGINENLIYRIPARKGLDTLINMKVKRDEESIKELLKEYGYGNLSRRWHVFEKKGDNPLRDFTPIFKKVGGANLEEVLKLKE